MAEDADLDAELSALLVHRGCKYAQKVPENIKAALRRGYDPKNPNWTAFVALCRNHGVEIGPDVVRRHFANGHDDDR